MSSSSAPTAPPKATTPPTGWTDNEAYMDRNYYWAGTAGDVKDMLSTSYGLRSAQPIWTRLPQYGDVLFIFQAVPSNGIVHYYVWNGMESSVCLIAALGLNEIQATINKFGEGKGYLNGLNLTVISGPVGRRSPLSESILGFSARHLKVPAPLLR